MVVATDSAMGKPDEEFSFRIEDYLLVRAVSIRDQLAFRIPSRWLLPRPSGDPSNRNALASAGIAALDRFTRRFILAMATVYRRSSAARHLLLSTGAFRPRPPSEEASSSLYPSVISA